MTDYSHLSDDELLSKMKEYKKAELVYNNSQMSAKIR